METDTIKTLENILWKALKDKILHVIYVYKIMKC